MEVNLSRGELEGELRGVQLAERLLEPAAPRGARETRVSPDVAFDFQGTVCDAFASFNRMRGAARNSMWTSLVCMLSAVGVESNPLAGFLPDLSHSIIATMILAWMDVIFGIAWFSAGSIDFKILFFGCLAGTISCAVAALFAPSDFPTTKAVTCVIVFVCICQIPLTVSTFRKTFLQLAKTHTKIY